MIIIQKTTKKFFHFLCQKKFGYFKLKQQKTVSQLIHFKLSGKKTITFQTTNLFLAHPQLRANKKQYDTHQDLILLAKIMQKHASV